MKKKWLIIGLCIALLLCLCVALYFFVLQPAQKQAEWDKAVAQYREAKYAQYRQENERYADFEVEVAFLQYLRPEIKFESFEQLHQQIKQDILQAKNVSFGKESGMK